MTDKPKTILFDGELALGSDKNGEAMVMSMLVQYVIPRSGIRPEEGVAYLMAGKPVSVRNGIYVPNQQEVEQYDLLVDVFAVCSVSCHHHH